MTSWALDSGRLSRNAILRISCPTDKREMENENGCRWQVKRFMQVDLKEDGVCLAILHIHPVETREWNSKGEGVSRHIWDCQNEVNEIAFIYND